MNESTGIKTRDKNSNWLRATLFLKIIEIFASRPRKLTSHEMPCLKPFLSANWMNKNTLVTKGLFKRLEDNVMSIIFSKESQSVFQIRNWYPGFLLAGQRQLRVQHLQLYVNITQQTSSVYIYMCVCVCVCVCVYLSVCVYFSLRVSLSLSLSLSHTHTHTLSLSLIIYIYIERERESQRDRDKKK